DKGDAERTARQRQDCFVKGFLGFLLGSYEVFSVVRQTRIPLAGAAVPWSMVLAHSQIVPDCRCRLFVRALSRRIRLGHCVTLCDAVEEWRLELSVWRTEDYGSATVQGGGTGGEDALPRAI